MEKRYLPKPRTKVADKELPSDLVTTFHYAIWPFTLIAQFMGVLPVSGVREKDVTRVHFKWIYVGVLGAMVLIGFETIDLFLTLKIIFERGFKMYTVGSVAFILTCLLGQLAFFRLARRWPDLMRQFTDTENVFMQRSYETDDSKGFYYRLRLFGGLLLVGAVVEHSMFMGNEIYYNYQQIKKCNLAVNYVEYIFSHLRWEIFSLIDMHMWMIPCIEWVTISTTFTWNFIDIFLTLITRSLAFRFDQISKKIRRFKTVRMTDEFWLSFRMDFVSLLDLLQAVDEHLSSLVLLSCTNNLYFICFRVFQSFQQRSSLVETIYFWYSLTFVLTRIFTMMLSAASINDKANDVLTAFYEIPMDFWGIELERFYEMAASSLISVSGKGFYFITRRMILAIAGTVVTYELVLLDQVKDVVDSAADCSSKKS